MKNVFINSLVFLIFAFGIFSHIFAAEYKCNLNASIDTWHECIGNVNYKKDQKYQGFFRFGKPDGVGVATFSNGYKYIGEFKKGEYNGIGAITDKNEKILQGGLWESGSFVQPRQIDLGQFKRGTYDGEIKEAILPPQEPPKQQVYQSTQLPPPTREEPRSTPL